MPKGQLGMHNNVQSHRIASVCKQTYDGSCIAMIICHGHSYLHATSITFGIQAIAIAIAIALPLLLAYLMVKPCLLCIYGAALTCCY